MILFSINSAAKILPKRSTEPGGISFKNSCQKAADLLSQTIDGKQKEFEASTTYANIKTILKNIQKSAYFEKLNQPQQPAENMELRKYSLAHSLLKLCINWEKKLNWLTKFIEDENSSEQSGDVKADDEANTANIPEETIMNVATNVNIEATTVNAQGESGTVDFQEAPSASAVPVPTFTPQQPHAVSPPGINAHSAPQNLQTLPQGTCIYIFLPTDNIFCWMIRNIR